jgi:hypothetical protein
MQEWRPTVVRVATVSFTTTLETLCQFPTSQLTLLFSPPFPLYDPLTDVHNMPPGLIPDPKTFEFILDFLRTLTWLPMTAAEGNAVTRCCDLLQLPAPGPLSFLKGRRREVAVKHDKTLTRILDCDSDVVRLTTTGVRLPVAAPRALMPSMGGSSATGTGVTSSVSHSPALAALLSPNAASISINRKSDDLRRAAADLGRRGYRVVKETEQPAGTARTGSEIVIWFERSRPPMPLARLVVDCAPPSRMPVQPLVETASWFGCLINRC